MSTSTRLTRTRWTVAGLAAASAVALVAAPTLAQPVPAHEPASPGTAASPQSTPYTRPLASLGGRTLAQYLAEHEARVVGPACG